MYLPSFPWARETLRFICRGIATEMDNKGFVASGMLPRPLDDASDGERTNGEEKYCTGVFSNSRFAAAIPIVCFNSGSNRKL